MLNFLSDFFVACSYISAMISTAFFAIRCKRYEDDPENMKSRLRKKVAMHYTGVQTVLSISKI